MAEYQDGEHLKVVDVNPNWKHLVGEVGTVVHLDVDTEVLDFEDHGAFIIRGGSFVLEKVA